MFEDALISRLSGSYAQFIPEPDVVNAPALQPEIATYMKHRWTGKKGIAVCLSLVSLAGISIYLELLGTRIVDSGQSLTDVWGWPFIAGSARTALGAVCLGGLFVLIALLPRKTRPWWKSHVITIWLTGALLFLLIMYLLILWAS